MRATKVINTFIPPLRQVMATLLLLSALSILVRPVCADGTTYATAQRQFKVGILLLDSTIDRTNNATIARGPENPDPYVFYIADAYNEVKPPNWEFINPLAPNAVTTTIRNRWLARDPREPYQIGQPVRKNMAAYWEVTLKDTPVEQLLQFDLLLITSHRLTSFTPTDREKLRKLVDAGGIVWMEDCGGMRMDGNNPFFLQDVQFQGTGFGAPKPVIYVPDHPILNTPFQLTYEEISTLGDKTYGSYSLCSVDSTKTSTDPIASIAVAPNPETLVNIIGNGNTKDGNGRALPYVAAGNYGGGSVLLTSGDSCCDINDYAGGVNAGSGGNSGAFCGPNIKTAHIEDLKFLYNAAAWGSANNAYRRNNRRLASSFEGVGAPLVNAFSTRNAFSELVQGQRQDIVDSRSAPLIVKNIMYVSGLIRGTTRITVRAYDLNPFRDLDGDGNPDDGRPDLSLGLPYDEIWRWDGPNTGNNGPNAGQYPSSPVFASVALNAAGDREDRIFVTLPDGTLVTLQALPRVNGLLSPTGVTPVAPLNGTGGNYLQMPRGVAPAPTFFENRLYLVEPNGLVVCVNAQNNNELWRTFTTAPQVPIQPCGTPTLGFSRQDTTTTFSQDSNGTTNDLMLYVPCLADDGNGGVGGRIFAYWLGTRNEVVSFKDNRDPENNQKGILNTRIAGGPGGPQADQYFMAPGGVFIAPRARVFSANPTTTPATTALQNYANGIVSPAYTATVDPNTGKVQVSRTNNAFPEANTGADILVSVDYDVMYIVGNKVPADYASNPTGVGARNVEALRIPFLNLGLNAKLANSYGLTTPTFSPDDALIFGANQIFQTTGQAAQGPNKPGNIASVFAVNEQEGLETTRIRWRFGIFNDIAPNSLTATRANIDDTTVEDRVPLVNYLIYDANWVTSSGAVTQKDPNAPTQDVAEPLKNIRIVGSPITTNTGITYVLAEAQGTTLNPNRTFSVLMAFKTSPQVVLNLPEPFETTRGVTISQADMLSDPNRAGVITIRSGSPQLTLDGDRGRITINNFRAANNSAFSASQSFVVRYTPKDGANEKRVVINPVPRGGTLNYGTGEDEQGDQVSVTPATSAFTPLLWYYVLPGQPKSSPTLVGDYIYYTMLSGGYYVVGVDANPTANDPQIRSGFGEPVINVVSRLDGKDNNTNHVRMVTAIASDPNKPLSTAEAPPVGGDGILAINTNFGTYAYTDNVTVIADNRRLIEVGADSAARWVLDSTLDSFVAGGKLPVYGPNGQPIVNPGDPQPNGRQVQSRQALSRPRAVQKVATDYLLADTGNNRVIRVDRSGRITWQLNSIADPYGLLSAGEPKTLNNPTDVQLYTVPTYDAAGTNVVGYEIHYLIADSGNYRIIEVADYYDANGVSLPAPTQDRQGNPIPTPGGTAGNGEHVLVWTTRTATAQGQKLRFASIQRYLGTRFTYITAVVGNSAVGTGSNGSTDFTGGSLVSLRYSPFNTYGSAWQNGQAEPTGNGTVFETIDQVTIKKQDGTTVAKKIIAPTFFHEIGLPLRGAGVVERKLSLICDGDGAYVVETAYAATGVRSRYVLWMFTQSDYDAMNASRIANPAGGKLPAFRPTAIQLLSNGDYLITNGATERNTLFASGQFVGEAFDVKPNGVPILIANTAADDWFTANGGTFDNFSSPKLVAGSAASPLNQQVMGNPRSNTGLLEQPQIAIRP